MFDFDDLDEEDARAGRSRSVASEGREHHAGEPAGMDDYRDLVRHALADDGIFETFKLDPRYRVVLEHVWPELGEEYLKAVLRDSPGLWAEMKSAVILNNEVGSPLLHLYPDVDCLVSPTQLRYLKVLSDLQRSPHVQRLAGLRVVELGVGYGGQCQLILAAHAIPSYTLIDFPEVEQLALRYLQKTTRRQRFSCVRLYQNLPSRSLDADLFVSNYAFSELNASLQHRYFQDVVQRSKHGYVTYNKAVDAGAMPLIEFVNMLRKVGKNPSISMENVSIPDESHIVTW